MVRLRMALTPEPFRICGTARHFDVRIVDNAGGRISRPENRGDMRHKNNWLKSEWKIQWAGVTDPGYSRRP